MDPSPAPYSPALLLRPLPRPSRPAPWSRPDLGTVLRPGRQANLCSIPAEAPVVLHPCLRPCLRPRFRPPRGHGQDPAWHHPRPGRQGNHRPARRPGPPTWPRGSHPTRLSPPAPPCPLPPASACFSPPPRPAFRPWLRPASHTRLRPASATRLAVPSDRPGGLTWAAARAVPRLC
jgi:hypothetical protein